MALKNQHKRLRVQASRQLMNYPLARDTRTQQSWHRSKPTGKWWLCELPGDKRIQFRLRGDIEDRLRHSPTPFDVNVLLLVLAQAEQLDRRQMSFASDNAMLQALKIGIDSGTRQRLRDSLDYWCELSILYRECWHKIGQKEPITKRLPVPLQSVGKEGHRVSIVLDEQWFQLRRRYFEKLTLPLPNSAAAQNLVLLLASRIREPITPHPDDDDPPRGHWTKQMSIETYCKKIGLTHSTRKAQFRRLLTDQSPLQAYYRAIGYDLHVIENPRGKFAFAWFKREPPPPRVRLQPNKSPPIERVKRTERPTTAPPRSKSVERVKPIKRPVSLPGEPVLVTVTDLPDKGEEWRKRLWAFRCDNDDIVEYWMWRFPDGEEVSPHELTDEQQRLAANEVGREQRRWKVVHDE